LTKYRRTPFLVQADAVPPYFFGATASAGTKNPSALQRAPVQKNLRCYSERRYKKIFGATASAGTKKSSALRRAPVQKNLRRYSERRYKKIFGATASAGTKTTKL